ncbi:unnamed protein product [Calypogeia fissa]
MKVQLLFLLLAATLAPLCYGLVDEASTYLAPDLDSCDCSETADDKVLARDYICGDIMLGPTRVPRKLPLNTFVSGYNRFGGLTPGDFLKKWTNPSNRSRWIYPKEDGFHLDKDGAAIKGTMVLEVGTLVDRFGLETGNFISAADAPFSQRALPPDSLNTNAKAPDYPYNYHLYKVIKNLTVEGGPITPWFGQPGLGAQFHIGNIGNILKLKEMGYLEELDPSEPRSWTSVCPFQTA